MFGHDGAYGTDLSVDPKSLMVAIFMVQAPAVTSGRPAMRSSRRRRLGHNWT
jgi:CubicO group peptidase (beta-lactamase class C family)